MPFGKRKRSSSTAMTSTRESGREESIEHTTEYDEFIEKLQEYHNKRGTILEREPKVAWRRVNLLQLYNRVTEEGGYDHVSDTRASPLAWRNFGVELGHGNESTPALAFSLKTAYYKNLAAYEITNFHGKEPPPKEVLEDVSARGGDLLTRTFENYDRRAAKENKLMANGVDSEDGETDRHGTPKDKEDRMDVDEPGSLGTRSSRGLRQAPAQRQFYQADATQSRLSRPPSSMNQSPGPPTNPYASSNGTYGTAQSASQALAGYDPKIQIPLTLRPVVTPGNNPEHFKATRQAASVRSSKSSSQVTRGGVILPGTGFIGPNVFSRTYMGLRSGIPEEQEYALHHLVKISYERGDKYRLDNFPGVGESLIDMILEAATIYCGVKWHISYTGDVNNGLTTIDGINGTPDILDRINHCHQTVSKDNLHTKVISRQLKLINEAGLVLRNMSMLPDNTEYLSRCFPIREVLTVILNLPAVPLLNELKLYAHEIAEQIVRDITPFSDDPLLQTLIAATSSPDRGIIISSLRALSRVGTSFQQGVPQIQALPKDLILRVHDWLLVEDQDLRSACLDLLYRYTTVIDNLELLQSQVDIQALVRQLVRLLQFGARTDDRQAPVVAAKVTPRLPSSEMNMEIPQVPKDLVEQLLVFDEPERSSQWLRTCFEEDPNGEITQIALWQAYQLPFAHCSALRPLLPAKDFITNVSQTFASASAQVLSQHVPPKFVIRGIKPRVAPVDPRGRTYMRCQWTVDEDAKCPEFAPGGKQLWQHIVEKHLDVVKDSDGQYDFSASEDKHYECHWNNCKRYHASTTPVSPFYVGMHVKTHLPDVSEKAYHRSKNNLTPDQQPPPVMGTSRSWTMHNTLTDERNDAAGLPLMAALILRNLARNIPRTNAAAKRGSDATVRALFEPVKQQLYYVMAYNRSLGEYLSTLTRFIDAEEVQS